MYLRDLSGHVPHVYVGVHVRRTDYINYIQTRYKAKHSYIHVPHVYVRVYVIVHLQKRFFWRKRNYLFFFLKIENENIFIFSTDFKELTFSIMFKVAHCNNFDSFLLLLYINRT